MSFQQLYRLGQRHGGGQRQQDVYVIFRSADNQSFETVLPGDSADERPQFRIVFRGELFSDVLW